MRIVAVIDELVFQVQRYDIPLLPIQPNQPLDIFNLQDAVRTAVDILYHLRDEEYESYKSFQYAKVIKEYGIYVDGALGQENLEVVPDALLWRQQFRSSFLSRLSTYTMTICSLDKMLEMTYRKLMEALSNTRYKDITPIKTLPKEEKARKEKLQQLLEPRRNEILHYKKLRDKVFAHTSYADPRNDTEDLQSASLAFYSGLFMRYAKDHVYVQIGHPLTEIDDRRDLSIFKDYFETMIPHYDNWSIMFIEILNQLSTINQAVYDY